MENNILDKYKQETNEILMNTLGLTIDELKSLGPEELKLLFLNTKHKNYGKINQSNNNSNKMLEELNNHQNNQVVVLSLDRFSIKSGDKVDDSLYSKPAALVKKIQRRITK